MANLNGQISLSIKDDSKKVKALPIYFTEPDTLTLADLSALALALGNVVDPITDGKIDRVRVIVEIPPSVSWKADPVSGSNDEETGLFTFPLVSPADKSYGIDVPAFPDGKTASADHNLINTADTAVAAFIDYITGTSAWKNDVWSSSFDAPVRSAIVTFRKLRRQLARRRRA